jgi:hypothetical protein
VHAHGQVLGRVPAHDQVAPLPVDEAACFLAELGELRFELVAKPSRPCPCDVDDLGPRSDEGELAGVVGLTAAGREQASVVEPPSS